MSSLIMPFEFTDIDRSVLDEVELISINSAEYQEWKANIISDKPDISESRQRIHENADISGFEYLASLAISNPGHAVSDLLELLQYEGPDTRPLVSNYEEVRQAVYHGEWDAPVEQPDVPPTRGYCRYSQEDEYEDDDDAYCCWYCSERPNNRPEKFDFDDEPVGECRVGRIGYRDLRDFIIDLTKIDYGENWLGSWVKDIGYEVGDIAATVNKLENEERQRAAALRLAWDGAISGFEYQYQQAEALLRDVGSEVANEPQAGAGGREFEGKVRDTLEDFGFELSDERVFRITFRDDAKSHELPGGASADEPFYKESDIVLADTDPVTIVEVFTQRDREEKREQLEVYQDLYWEARRENPQGMLLTNQLNQQVLTLETLELVAAKAADELDGQSGLSDFI